MKYENIVRGVFVSRPNRFIAHVLLGDETVVCHVKNTGRCRELLIPGVVVILEFHPDAAVTGRKTSYDLIGVYKGEMLINMDSQAPNKAAWEWLGTERCLEVLGEAAGIVLRQKAQGDVLSRRQGTAQADVLSRRQGMAQAFPRLRVLDLRREVTYGDSRFDLAFSLEVQGQVLPAFMEVKGVTLEENGIAMFPDAPTERGIKHLNGLVRAKENGFMAFVLFVIQMKGITEFTPNMATHPEFGHALKRAREAGVSVLAMDCVIAEDCMRMDQPVKVRI